jgi:hypothetical protein
MANVQWSIVICQLRMRFARHLFVTKKCPREARTLNDI